MDHFYQVTDSISIIDVIFMSDSRVPPYTLREDAVQKVHAMGHLDIAKRLNLLEKITGDETVPQQCTKLSENFKNVILSQINIILSQ